MGEGAREVNNVVCFVDSMVSVTFTAMVMPSTNDCKEGNSETYYFMICITEHTICKRIFDLMSVSIILCICV